MRSRPTLSMEALMSVKMTRPFGPTFCANSLDKSPLPPAMSNTVSPALTPLISTAKRFQVRCRPADMTSFIKSYLLATEWKTSPTFLAFSPSATVLKPKWVCCSLDMCPSLIRFDSSRPHLVYLSTPTTRLRSCAPVRISNPMNTSRYRGHR